MNAFLLSSLSIVVGFAATSVSAANRFVEAGFPAPDREWTGADYEAVANALKTGAEFPTLRDADGAEMFRRIVNPQNFALLQNQNLPISERLPQIIPLMSGCRDILSAYIVAANQHGADVHEELAHLMVFMLRATVVGLKLADEFMPTIPRDDTYPIRMEGLERMRASSLLVFSGVEQSLGERGFYSAKDLSLMLEGMRETIPSAVQSFTVNYRAELRGKLRRRIGEFPAPADQQALAAILAALDRKIPSAETAAPNR